MFGVNLGSLYVRLLADASQYTKTLLDATTTLNQASVKMGMLGMRMTMMLTLPLTLLGRAAVRAFADFDEAMVRSLAIMDDVSDETRKKMEDTAKTLSTKSLMAPAELAVAYKHLASAGMSAEQS